MRQRRHLPSGRQTPAILQRSFGWPACWSGDWEEAEILAQRATDKGQYTAMISLAVAREETWDRTGAEALARRAADTGRLSPLTLEIDGQTHTALLRYFPHGLGPDGVPSLPWTEAVPGTDSRFAE